ncbi:hypothetical protein HKD37_16G046010 [Glycine soja]
MCPLRFILVFFSAVLAGYFAWKTVRSDPKIEVFSEDSANEDKSFKKEDFDFKKMIQNGFWGFVDMASGRYLWRNLRPTNKDAELKKCLVDKFGQRNVVEFSSFCRLSYVLQSIEEEFCCLPARRSSIQQERMAIHTKERHSFEALLQPRHNKRNP